MRVPVEVGQVVAAGEVAVVISAMKMENEVTFAAGGRVAAVHVAAGQAVKVGMLLVSVTPEG